MTAVLFERRNHEQNLSFRRESGPLELRKALEIHEEEFLWKREIFLQQPVSDERSPRIGQHVLRFSKTHRLKIPHRNFAHGGFRVRRITHQNSHAISAQ